MVPFAAFEKMASGTATYRLLDRHPDGKYLAMQGKAWRSGRSAVWEQESRRLVWAPERAIALAWLRNGTQIAVLQEANASPYECVVYTWPERQVLQICPVSPPARCGEMLDLTISPVNDLALCQWIDQSEAGFEFLDMTPQGLYHDTQAGYFLEGTNDVTRPAFSPDGHYWAFGYKQHEIWWAPDPEDIETYDQPARGGLYPLGALLIFQGKQPLPHPIPLIATLPPGWRPTDPDAEEVLCIADPLFLDEQHVQVRLPSGETQVHRVPVD